MLTNQVNFKDMSQILPNLGSVMHNLVPGLEGRAVKSSSENNEVDSWDRFWCVAHLEVGGVPHLPECCCC